MPKCQARSLLPAPRSLNRSWQLSVSAGHTDTLRQKNESKEPSLLANSSVFFFYHFQQQWKDEMMWIVCLSNPVCALNFAFSATACRAYSLLLKQKTASVSLGLSVFRNSVHALQWAINRKKNYSTNPPGKWTVKRKFPLINHLLLPKSDSFKLGTIFITKTENAYLWAQFNFWFICWRYSGCGSKFFFGHWSVCIQSPGTA